MRHSLFPTFLVLVIIDYVCIYIFFFLKNVITCLRQKLMGAVKIVKEFTAVWENLLELRRKYTFLVHFLFLTFTLHEKKKKSLPFDAQHNILH